MISLKLGKETQSKTYLQHFSQFYFQTSIDFIVELFFKNHLEPTEQDEVILELIKHLGYHTIHEIPTDILQDLEKIYFDTLAKQRLEMDKEKMAYLLLDKLDKQEIILIVDNQVIDDLMQEVQLTEISTIIFFNQSFIQDTTFKAL